MGTLTGGIVAFIAGLGLAGATVVGVVQSQESAGEKPISSTNVSYGSNNCRSASRRDEGRAPRSPPFVRPGLLLPPERLEERREVLLGARPGERVRLCEGAAAEELAPFVVLDQGA